MPDSETSETPGGGPPLPPSSFQGRTEEALRRSEARLAAIFERAEVGISEISPGGLFLRVNETLCRMLGRSRPELLRLGVADVTHGDDAPRSVLELRRLLETGEPVSLDKRYLRPDGSVIWANSRLSLLKSADGEPPSVLAVTADLTARRKAEEAVRESGERLRLIIESAHDHAIFSMDLERRVTSWNSGAERLLGYTEEEILGESGDIIFTAEDRRQEAPERETGTALREGRAANERWHARRDGSRFWGSGMTTLMRNTAGEPAGFVKIMRDQTREREAVERIEAARAEAEAAGRAKDHFLAVLSHELRTPLTPVLMALDNMLHGDFNLTPFLRGSLEMALRNVTLEAQLIDDLLDMTSIARGKFELSHDRLDAHEVLKKAVEVCQPGLTAKKHRLEVTLEAEACSINGDATRLQQLFWNLIKNACKFTSADGEIRIATRNPGPEMIEIEVADNGCGMDAEALERIFEPFVQAEKSITRRFGGLGLGLAISKAVAEAHGGTLSAGSPGEGKGAVFTVALPVLPNDGQW